MTEGLEDMIREYVEEDIPTSPGGGALVKCKHIGISADACDLCGGSGWRMIMLRRLTPVQKGS